MGGHEMALRSGDGRSGEQFPVSERLSCTSARRSSCGAIGSRRRGLHDERERGLGHGYLQDGAEHTSAGTHIDGVAGGSMAGKSYELDRQGVGVRCDVIELDERHCSHRRSVPAIGMDGRPVRC